MIVFVSILKPVATTYLTNNCSCDVRLYGRYAQAFVLFVFYSDAFRRFLLILTEYRLSNKVD